MKRGSSGGDDDDARKKNKVALLRDDEEAGFAALVSTTITLVELRRVCERLGLPTVGSQQVLRSVIAARLAEEKSLDNVPASARTARGVEPLKDPASTFRALPRDMMAKALLPHVFRPLALGLTCTYMTQICIDEQKRRCQMIFRPYFPVHGLETFSPMTMSLLEKMVDAAENAHMLYEVRENPLRRYNRCRALVGLPTVPIVSPGNAIPRDEITRILNDTRKLAPVAGAAEKFLYPIPIVCVKQCITEYGSVEAALRKKNDETRKQNLESEVGSRRRKAQDDRLLAVNNHLFGGMPIYKLNDARSEAELNGAAGNVMAQFLFLEPCSMLSSHIVTGGQERVNAERFFLGTSRVYATYRALIPEMAKVIRWVGDAVFKYANGENGGRLIYWTRLFFCPDSTWHGALLSRFASLTAEWVDALVARIANETALPVGFPSKEEVLHVVVITPASLCHSMTHVCHRISDERPAHIRHNRRQFMTLAGHDSEKNWVSNGRGWFGVQWRGSPLESPFQSPLILIYDPPPPPPPTAAEQHRQTPAVETRAE